jgi:hypothetical protein
MFYNSVFSQTCFNRFKGVDGGAVLDFTSESFWPFENFTRASNGTFFDSSGINRTVGNNVRRYDHDPLTLTSKGLLIEGARTNLILESTPPSVAGTNFAFNRVLSPATTGSLNGFPSAIYIPNFDNNLHFVRPVNFAWQPSTQYTYSFYARAAGYNIIHLEIPSVATDTGVSAVPTFNLSTGVVTQNGPSTSAMDNLGGGVYRIRVTFTTSASPGTFYPATYINIFGSFIGDGVSGVELAAYQFEQAAFSSSYIPTTGAAATRAVDEATITNLSTIGFNPLEGTLFIEYEYVGVDPTGNQWIAQFDDGTGNNRVSIGTSANTTRMNTTVGGVVQPGLAVNASPVANTIYKAAIAYKAADFAAVQNGGTVQTSALISLPTGMTRLRLANNQGGVANGFLWIRNVTYIPTRLPNAQLQRLTT